MYKEVSMTFVFTVVFSVSCKISDLIILTIWHISLISQDVDVKLDV